MQDPAKRCYLNRTDGEFPMAASVLYQCRAQDHGPLQIFLDSDDLMNLDAWPAASLFFLTRRCANLLLEPASYE